MGPGRESLWAGLSRQPLRFLAAQLVSESIPGAAGGVLLLKGSTAIPGLGGGVGIVRGRGAGGGVVERDGILVVSGKRHEAVMVAAAMAAVTAAIVAVTGTAHDVADLDAARLAVPETEADDEEEDEPEGEGQGNLEGAAGGRQGGRGVVEVGVGEDGGQGEGAVLEVAAVGGAEEGDGDVGGGAGPEEAWLDPEGPEAPGGGDAVVGLEVDHAVVGAVEVFEADGDLAAVGAGAVVEVGVPGHWRLGWV